MMKKLGITSESTPEVLDEHAPRRRPAEFRLIDQAKRLGELLSTRSGVSPEAVTTWYELYYSPESNVSAHANGTSTGRYYSTALDGRVGINFDPPELEADLMSMVHSIRLTWSLASYLSQELALDEHQLNSTPGLQALMTWEGPEPTG